MSLSNPTATSRQYPLLGKYRVRSAITNPTLKKILVAGRNGIIPSDNVIMSNLFV